MKNINRIILAAFFALLSLASCNNTKKAVEAMQLPTNQAQIIYVYDPLCGWCYAFKGIMQEFKQAHSGEIDFTILSGGMVIGEPKDSIGKMKEFFSESIPMLEGQTGAKFGDGFKRSLKLNGQELFSSEKPAIALTVFKSMMAKNSSSTLDAFSFAASIQSAIYSDGMPPESVIGYKSLADKAGIDAEEFAKRLSDSSYYKKTWREFAISRGLKANGYPTVFLLKSNGKLIKLTDGYTSLSALEASYQKHK